MRFRKPSPENIDFYYKMVCPTIMICLTIFAITTARLVYGVQQQAADLNNKGTRQAH